jgi:predicted acylesterase/phospholipase RssA
MVVATPFVGTHEASRMSTLAAPPRPASYDKMVALVLQGGGALGSYQAGVYEAL